MSLAGEILGRNLDFPDGKISCTDPIKLTSQVVFNNPKFPIVERPRSPGVSFQFFTRLAAVFAEEVGDFWSVAFNGLI